MGSGGRTYRNTRCILAMLALERIDGIFDVRIYTFFFVFEADKVMLHRKFILILASHLASEAANTLFRLDNHSVTGHAYSPTFLTLTTTSIRSAVPDIGSIAKALNSLGLTPKP